jgi:hypothetical protein
MHELFMADSTRASTVMSFLWDVCDPDIPSPHPDDAYRQCLCFLVHDFFNEELLGTPESRLEFLDDATSYVRDFRNANAFAYHPFHVMAGIIVEWCHDHRDMYE